MTHCKSKPKGTKCKETPVPMKGGKGQPKSAPPAKPIPQKKGGKK